MTGVNCCGYYLLHIPLCVIVSTSVVVKSPIKHVLTSKARRRCLHLSNVKKAVSCYWNLIFVIFFEWLEWLEIRDRGRKQIVKSSINYLKNDLILDIVSYRYLRFRVLDILEKKLSWVTWSFERIIY